MKKSTTFKSKVDNFFEITQRGSNFKTEIFAGITTFFAMCYIIVVNPGQITGFVEAPGEINAIRNAIFVGGILASVIGTLLMAFLAKMPFAQAPGMGLNAFFFVCFMLPVAVFGANGITGFDNPASAFGAGLAVILISGLIFLILSVSGLRSYIAKSIPTCLKTAIPAGIGLFIAFIGLKNSFIITDNPFTFVQLADLSQRVVHNEYGAVIGGWAPFVSAFLGFILIGILANSKNKGVRKGSIIISILITTVVYYVLTWTLPEFRMQSIGQVFKDFGNYGFSVFNAESWNMLFSGAFGNIFNVIMIIITFCLVDMFDTVGTLYGTCSQADMLDEHGDPQNIDKCMLCDSIATVSGSLLGTSTVSTYVESSAGVAEGGRTGLTSVVVSLCFLVCLFLSPFASIIPMVATAPALVYVGVLMMKNFAKVDMSNPRTSIPAFLTLIMMPLTYSIANGIGIGAIAYVLITLFTGNYKKSDITITVIAILFALRFFLVQM